MQAPTFTSRPLPSKMTVLLALAATLALLVAPSTSAGSDPLRADFHGCGSIPSLTSWSIKAKRVSCERARKVVRAYVSAMIEGGDSTQDVLGFRCKLTGYYGDGGNYRCGAPGHRVIRFSRGG